MVKILSQGGRSLADMYQVEGSIAGIDQLETRELPIVHEMGATLFSERFRTTFRRGTTGPVAQSATPNISITNMPEGISRILGVQVITDDSSRIANVQVSVHDAVAAQDFPIWTWEVGNSDPIRLTDNAVGLTAEVLVPNEGQLLPCFVTNGQTRLEISQIHLRADTTAFGAGNVFLTLLVHFAFTFTGGVSAFGARVPSW